MVAVSNEGAESFTVAILAVFRFYFQTVFSFGRIHPDVSNGRMLPLGKAHVGKKLAFDASFAKDFNGGLQRLEEETRKCRRHTLGYDTILRGCHILRWATCFTACVAPWYALPVGAVQFLLAPLSIPICVMKLFTYGMEGVLHYLFAVLFGMLFGGYGPVFTVDPYFLFFFLAVDQLVNFVVYMLWSEPFETRCLLTHVFYGTANTKLYYVVVFGCLRGLQVDILLLVLTSAATMVVVHFFMPELLDLLGIPCKDVRFYMDHRIGHLPVVYQHAHKMHHQLHDTTAWDAHTYGNGMNEHFLLMVLDALPCMLAPSIFHVPYCFNAHLMYVTWANKPHHTRLKPGTPYDYYMNYHADHHTLHSKNFALMGGALLDFYFGTQGSKTKGTNGVLFSREERAGDDGKPGEIVIEVSEAPSVEDTSEKHSVASSWWGALECVMGS